MIKCKNCGWTGEGGDRSSCFCPECGGPFVAAPPAWQAELDALKAKIEALEAQVERNERKGTGGERCSTAKNCNTCKHDDPQGDCLAARTSSSLFKWKWDNRYGFEGTMGALTETACPGWECATPRFGVWMPVECALPEFGQPVIASDSSPFVFSALRCTDGRWAEGLVWRAVIAWMPLPEPWKGADGAPDPRA